MSDINQFRPSKATTAIIVGDPPTTAAQMPLFDLSAGPTLFNKKVILSGAVTATVYKTLLSVTGAGVINYLGARTKSATTKVSGLRVTIDGIVVYDVQTSNVGQTNRILTAIGYLTYNTVSGSNYMVHDQVVFNYSLLVEIYSSVGETDQTELITSYNLH